MRAPRCVGLLALTLTLTLLLAACGGPARRAAEALADPELQILPLGGDFVLTGDDGKPFDSRRLRGQVQLLFFGYTSCPDVCPTTLARQAEVHRLLAAQRLDRRVQTVFVSVDPERDTPEVLHRYLSYFTLPVQGATGSTADLHAVAERFGATFERVAIAGAAGYTVDHSAYLYLIDGQGRVRHLFSREESAQRVAELTARLIRANCCG